MTRSDTPSSATTDDAPAEAALRREVRAWMQQHAAQFGPAQRQQPLGDVPESAAAERRWQRQLAEGGWAVPTWPEAFGGRGFGPNEARILREEQFRYAVPSGLFAIGVAMVGPTLMAHGTVEQQQRFLPAIRQGDHIWCQLFSEPDAGSDLASLRTKAERDGDGWVVTGQKVWTSGARSADWGILLARTERGSQRHQGITYFLCDMRSPGVEVRPLVQINRAAHFNEVILDQVRIPDDCVLGEVGDGWSVARTTLGAERVLIGSIDVSDQIGDLITTARKNGRADDPTIRQELMRLHIQAATLRFLGDRVQSAVRSGGQLGPEASTIKLGISLFMERLGTTAMRVLDAEGLLAGDGANGYGPLQDMCLGQWMSRIGGGTEEIQRNLIGERALGLPREPRPGHSS